jgi:hypothetical protein
MPQACNFCHEVSEFFELKDVTGSGGIGIGKRFVRRNCRCGQIALPNKVKMARKGEGWAKGGLRRQPGTGDILDDGLEGSRKL